MKKKLMIFPGNFLPNIGGLETHVDEFVRYFSKKNNFEIIIITPNVHNVKSFEEIYPNVKVIRYPALFLVPNFPLPKFWKLNFWKIWRDIRKISADVVMTRTRFFTNSTLGLFYSKLRIKKVPLIHVEHGSDYVKLDSKFKNFVAYLYDKTFGLWIFKAADRVVGVSETVKKFVQKEFIPRKKVLVIRRGIDKDYIDSIKEDKEFKKKFSDKITILFIGRLYKWKGVENLIRAFQTLPEKIKKKSNLIIGGFGEDEEKLKKIAETDKGKNIFFLGKVPFGKNYALMKASDIHVHSSFPGGGLASTLMQFMYCKNAIVASPHEGANEIVIPGKSGILLKDNSVKEIKTALSNLIEDKKKIKDLQNKASKYISKELSWKKTIEEYEKLMGGL